jgi:hypothetical protein
LCFYGAIEFSRVALSRFLVTALVWVVPDKWVLPEWYLFVSHQWFNFGFSPTNVCSLCPSNNSNLGFFRQDFPHFLVAAPVNVFSKKWLMLEFRFDHSVTKFRNRIFVPVVFSETDFCTFTFPGL